MFQKEFVQKIKTNILRSIAFSPENRAFLRYCGKIL